MSETTTKELLAYLRRGDFAHPGEIDAIELALATIAKKNSQRILDVGCGLGGTANYVQQQGWGQVVGIDLDPGLVQYAKNHYPEISFIQGDIHQAQAILAGKFQVIYSFSAFFCFASQQTVLQQWAQIAEKHAELVIFDYSRPNVDAISSPFPWSKTATRFSPIYLPELKSQLAITGWVFKESLDITQQFHLWYTQLMQQFDLKRESLINRFGIALFSKMYEGYSQLLMAIEAQKIGGIIVYASRDE